VALSHRLRSIAFRQLRTRIRFLTVGAAEALRMGQKAAATPPRSSAGPSTPRHTERSSRAAVWGELVDWRSFLEFGHARACDSCTLQSRHSLLKLPFFDGRPRGQETAGSAPIHRGQKTGPKQDRFPRGGGGGGGPIL